MTVFWLYAGLLFVAALSFILVPQLRRPRGRLDADRSGLNVSLYHERLRELKMQHSAGTLDWMQFEAGRIESARELLHDTQRLERAVGAPLGRIVPLIAALSAPLLGLALYLHWGSLDQVVKARQHPGRSTQSIEKITTHLKTLLAATPDSAEGWSLLGRAYMAENRMTDAANAFERATTLAGRPAGLLGRWAQALYFAGGQQWTPQLQALTDEALASNPQEAVSLELVGMAAFHVGRYVEAATYWERLLATLSEEDPSRAAVAADVARAHELAAD
ncbi:c-type cytochrome biogenesis protein CcmI [Allopusillimonas ginsengisoli]|nr:c-type cytochrome biogenesis protein CcmI [Allopusillimonas ginsengisoli]